MASGIGWDPMGAEAFGGGMRPSPICGLQTGSWGNRYADLLFSTLQPLADASSWPNPPRARGKGGSVGSAQRVSGAGGEEECGDWLVRTSSAVGGGPAPQLRPSPSFPVSACKPYQTPSSHSNATTLVKPSTVPSVETKGFLPVLSSQAVPSAGPQ